MAEKTQSEAVAPLKTKAKSSSTTTKTSSSTVKKAIIDKTYDNRTTINAKDKTVYGTHTNAPSTSKLAKNTVTLKNSTKPDTSMYSRTTRSKNLTQKPEPLRGKYSAAIVASIKKNNELLKKQSIESKTQVVKANAVLDHVHNVTVLSPPMRRKSVTAVKQETILENASISSGRPGTRTLKENEIIVLRPEKTSQVEVEIIPHSATKSTKKPLAYDVGFELPKSSKPRIDNNKNSHTGSPPNSGKSEDAIYSDDFESYESDFETGSSSPQDSIISSETPEESESDFSSNKDERNNNVQSTQDAEDDEEEEESFSTLYPVTVIQKEKDQERKLDSGNYDMSSRKNLKLSEIIMQSTQVYSQFDSLDGFSVATSDQMDSGISAYETSALKEFENTNSATFYEGYARFFSNPPLTKTGMEIMSKIQFDTLTYTLFESKPLSYEIFMQIYGRLHTTQSYAQTNENRLNTDTQTEAYETCSKWTQHPVKYNFNQNCFGQLPETIEMQSAVAIDELDASLIELDTMRKEKDTNMQQMAAQYARPIDFDKLNMFLIRATNLMSHVLNKVHKSGRTSTRETFHKESFSMISNEIFSLDTEFLNSLQVIRVFANPVFDLIVTVHESLPGVNVYSSEFSNLLVVWSTKQNESNNPIRLLSTWSKVCRVEICNASSEIVVCGLVDGSLAMWDLHETYSHCSKLDGCLTHFAATQSIVPILDKTTRLVDLGAMVDVRSFRTSSKSNLTNDYKTRQLASLNESGIVTIWTLVEVKTPLHYNSTTPMDRSSGHKQTLEYRSPWARLKLIQSRVCNIRDYIEKSIFRKESTFEKTKKLFQREIYNDDALKEFKSMQNDSGRNNPAIRFTSLETASEVVYISTNQNFIFSCSKTLKTERFRKIMLKQSSLFPTALCMLSNEDFLAVGFSNGSVSIINCNQNKLQYFHQKRPQTTAPIQNGERERLPTGKCCAIQNIILNERRVQNEMQNYADLSIDARPDTATCISMIDTKKKPYELRDYDQQMIIYGHVLRQHLVHSLALSSDGWRLFILTNKSLRLYDFFLEQEVELPASLEVLNVATARTRVDEQHLIVLNAKREVNVFNLKL